MEGSEGAVNKVSSGNAGSKGSVEHAGGDVRCDFLLCGSEPQKMHLQRKFRACCQQEWPTMPGGGGGSAGSADLHKIGRLSTAA